MSEPCAFVVQWVVPLPYRKYLADYVSCQCQENHITHGLSTVFGAINLWKIRCKVKRLQLLFQCVPIHLISISYFVLLILFCRSLKIYITGSVYGFSPNKRRYRSTLKTLQIRGGIQIWSNAVKLQLCQALHNKARTACYLSFPFYTPQTHNKGMHARFSLLFNAALW